MLLEDKRFGLTKENLKDILDVRRFIGCAPRQTEEFINKFAKPVIEKNKDLLGLRAEINV